MTRGNFVERRQRFPNRSYASEPWFLELATVPRKKPGTQPSSSRSNAAQRLCAYMAAFNAPSSTSELEVMRDTDIGSRRALS
jgi:hypothetical protein